MRWARASPRSCCARSARAADDPEAVKRVGVHWATEQCRDLLDNQVRGIHFYTLNKSDATRQIYQSLGLRDSTSLRDSSQRNTERQAAT